MNDAPFAAKIPRTESCTDHYDVAIIGAGFSGALLAWILATRGRRVLLVDRDVHPRFAVGESSTPLADLTLKQLANRYGLAELDALATYGSWKDKYPELVCGCKRGFSYFRHHQDRPFEDSPAHESSLLVAASRSHASSDTHWLRSDVDHFLCKRAIAAGVELREQSEANIMGGTPWRVELSRRGDQHDPNPTERETIMAQFVVVAAGRGDALQETLGVQDHAQQLLTRTRSTFAHFAGVPSWSQWLERHGHRDATEPFDADAAAQHHLLDEGWLWMLRMDDGRTSVGWTRAEATPPPANSTSIVERLGIDRYPSLRELFSEARCIAPERGLVESSRLQRLRLPMAGEDWALMPTAAVTIDPLHSGGIAHGLAGVERLAAILLQSDRVETRRAALRRYEADVLAESRLLDRMIATSYRAMPSFPLFVASTMVYFAGAIRCEERRAAGECPSRLWSADDAAFVDLVEQTHDRIDRLMQDHRRPEPSAVESFVAWLTEQLAPWNSAGLLDPSVANRYRYTAAEKSSAS